MPYENKTEIAGQHYALTPTVAELDREMRELDDDQIERLASKVDYSKIGGRTWESWTTAERRQVRASNERARRAQQAKLQAERDEQERKVEAREQARIDAAVAQFRAQARAAWMGDQQSFDSAWPRLLEDWRIEQVKATQARVHKEVQARIGDLF